MNFNEIQEMADNLSVSEYSYYRDQFFSIAKLFDENGVTLLKNLKKVPKGNATGDFVYEFEMSDPVKSFLSFMEQEFRNKDQDLRLAITVRVLNEAMKIQ